MATAQPLSTRGAVIFGDNSQGIVNNAISVMDRNRQAQEARDARRAQQLANSWRQNMLTASSGRLWSDQLSKLEQEHISQGENLMASGIDPYSSVDPRAVQYRQERANIENMRAYRKGVETELNAINNVVRKDINLWRTEDLDKLNEFISGTNINDAYSQNLTLPQVRRRFNIQDALKGYRAPMREEVRVENDQRITNKYVDRSEAETSIISRLGQTPGGAEYLANLTGGYSIPQLKNAPNDIEGTIQLIDNSYNSNPQFRERLAAQGIVSKSDPRYTDFITQEAQNMLAAKNNYETEIDGLIGQVSGGTTVKDSRVNDYTRQREERAQRNENRANTRLNMQITRFNERHMDKGKSTANASSYTANANEELAYGSNDSMKKTNLRGYTKFNANNVEFIGNGAIDLRTGQPLPNVPVRNGTVVALGQVPVNKNTGALMSESEAKNNPSVVNWKKMALTESKSSVGNFKNQSLVPAESLPANMPKKDLYEKFMNANIEPPRVTAPVQQKANTSKGKASASTLNFFK